ncbi:hypothetical protein QBC45DRAFT_392478 [Copromyces sp. CBS 386.78]|nr:hypothetical protein QBC45DRAFT_392478 [Copromyces sp. CBS 386.78]
MVKCDKVRPSCKACSLPRETYVYPTTTQLISGSSASKNSILPITPTDCFGLQIIEWPSPGSDNSSGVVIREPLFIPKDRTEAELKLLWFYSPSTFKSFAADSGPVDTVNHVLKVKLEAAAEDQMREYREEEEEEQEYHEGGRRRRLQASSRWLGAHVGAGPTPSPTPPPSGQSQDPEEVDAVSQPTESPFVLRLR